METTNRGGVNYGYSNRKKVKKIRDLSEKDFVIVYQELALKSADPNCPHETLDQEKFMIAAATEQQLIAYVLTRVENEPDSEKFYNFKTIFNRMSRHQVICAKTLNMNTEAKILSDLEINTVAERSIFPELVEPQKHQPYYRHRK